MTYPKRSTTTVCVVGCGPAGAMLGLLLARAGIEVVVLEKHVDFLRDFRGDTVHPSTVATQAFQRLAQRFGVDRALRGGAAPDYRAIGKLRPVRRLLGRLIGVGVLPEHVRVPARGTPRPEPATGR